MIVSDGRWDQAKTYDGRDLVAVFVVTEQRRISLSAGYGNPDYDDTYGHCDMTPEQAREVAQMLLSAADRAEGKT